MRQKHRTKGTKGTIGNNRASSRRLVFVGRLHTSATSPLMKASRKLDLGGISPIMGPRNPGGCYFRKKKAPARNAPVVVGIGFHRKSQIQRILTKRNHLPKRYARQNDATSFLYPMPISFFNLFTKLIHFEGNRQKSIFYMKNSRSTALAAVM